jgi:3-hydroxyisobutyrate dehydrogenase
MAQHLRVGFAGLGRMGTPMARNLAAAGFPLAVWTRTAAKARALASELGVQHCATPAELAASSDVLVTMVADAAALEAVYDGSDGALASIPAGATAVEGHRLAL